MRLWKCYGTYQEAVCEPNIDRVECVLEDSQPRVEESSENADVDSTLHELDLAPYAGTDEVARRDDEHEDGVGKNDKLRTCFVTTLQKEVDADASQNSIYA